MALGYLINTNGITLPSEYDFGLKELKLDRLRFASDFD
jgi:hypothetical protein